MSSEKNPKPGKILSQAEKLLKIRTVLKLKRSAMARKIIANDAQYAHWERGDIQLPAWAEANLFRELSVNPEWWRGKSQSLFMEDVSDDERKDVRRIFDELWLSNDTEITDHLARHVLLLKELYERRRKK